jgi:folate-binding protein YgfZ
MWVTCLKESLVSDGARLAEYCGAETAASFSDPVLEYQALKSSCGVYDLGWRAKGVVMGADRVRWLNGMVSNNIRDLARDRGVYAFLLNAQGHIQADLYVYNRGEYLVVDTEAGEWPSLQALFDRFIIMDDVEVTGVSEKLTALGVQGPSAEDVLGSIGIQRPDLSPLGLADFTWNDAGITLVRAETWKCHAYEIWASPENIRKLWRALGSAKAIPVGTEALEWFRIAAGIPRFGVDIRERDLPQETGQDRALHFAKGCYVGQEIVERIHARGQVHRLLTKFQIDGAPPQRGTKLMAGGKEVGEITSAAILPEAAGQVTVALGYLRREAFGKELSLAGTSTAVHQWHAPALAGP